MITIHRFDDWNKVSTKKELMKELRSYKGILNPTIYDYLNSLVGLEFSVIRNNITEKDRIALSELQIYKKIAIYNIYKRALNLVKQNDAGFEISGNNNGIEGLEVSLPTNKTSRDIFRFDYSEGSMAFEDSIPDGYTSTKLGYITLFQTVENIERREAEIERLNNLLTEARKIGPFRKINDYYELIQQLKSKKGLTDEEKKEIEVTQLIHGLLLEDYGLTNDDFEEKISTSDNCEKTRLQKTLVKTMPKLTINDSIKYI